MARVIKFRGKSVKTGEWLYGYLQKYQETHASRLCVCAASVRTWSDALLYEVIPETIGQFTGLNDKNGKEIYEGDIIRYADIDEYVVNPDCDLHLHFSQSYVKVIEDVVIFANGAFSLSDDIYPRPISVYGIKDIKDLRDWLGIKDDEDTDCNGTIINESLLGIEIVGNICENFGIVK